jgi:hypothetical protein
MSRLVILDGFRGYFLLFMAVVHYDGLIGSWLGKLHHQYFGWVEDAQGFVFISGLVVGLVYGRKYLRTPTVAAIYGPILARVRTIYSHQAGLVLILLTAALLLGPMAAPDFAPFRDAPVTFAVSSLMLLSSSANMGILPMYIGFMLVVPLAFRLLHRDQVAPYFALMLLLWLIAQTNLTGFAFYQAQVLLTERGIPAAFGLYFNLFGWQVLFFGGLFIGFRMAQRRLDLGFLHQPQFRTAFFIALAAITLLGVYDIIVELLLLGDDYSTRILIRTDRAILGFFYPVAFAIDLFAITWLLRVGPEDRLPWVRRAAAGAQWLFTRPALVVLGQHSLHVFSFHILVYYLLATVVPLELSPASRMLLLVASVASLYLAAFGHQWVQNRDTGAATAAAR